MLHNNPVRAIILAY